MAWRAGLDRWHLLGAIHHLAEWAFVIGFSLVLYTGIGWASRLNAGAANDFTTD